MIYMELSPDAEMSAPYMITRTKLTSPTYDGAIRPLLSSLGEDGDSYWQDITEGLTLLRATVMNPFSVDANPDYLLGFTDAIRRVAMHFLGDAPATGGKLVREQPDLQRKVDVIAAVR
jgi:hypothetical protein